MQHVRRAIADASRSKLTSELAQLCGRVSSRRRVYKDGARAAVVIKAIISNNRSERKTYHHPELNVTRRAIVFVVEPQHQHRRPPFPHDHSLSHCVRPAASELRWHRRLEGDLAETAQVQLKPATGQQCLHILVVVKNVCTGTTPTTKIVPSVLAL